jgi:hypothetical protein
LLFLAAIAVFFLTESWHRDRELRFEPVLWSAPIPNMVLLGSKFTATFLLSLSFSVLVGSAAIALQFIRGHTPFEVMAYLRVYVVILLPSMLLMISLVAMLNVIFREKYVAYTIGFSISLGLIYLYGQGHKHWLYNPVLQGLWTPADLSGPRFMTIVTHRVYVLALAAFFLAVAQLGFQRREGKGWKANGRLNSKFWGVALMASSVAVAVLAGIRLARIW